MTDHTTGLRRLLASRSVATILAIQLLVTAVVFVAQYSGFNEIAYTLGIVPELAIILYAILGAATGIPFLSVSTLLPFGIIFFLAAYYFIAVTVAVPGRVAYRFSRRLAVK